MSKRPVPPSSSARAAVKSAKPTKSATKRPGNKTTPHSQSAVDVQGWVSGIRLSSFMVIMLSLVVLGAWVLVPTLGTYIDQRQQIAALKAAVRVSEEQIAALEEERARWNDPAFITTQARERLYYFKPGEVVYLVDNDLDPDALPQEQGPVSDTIQERPSDWMPQLMRTLTGAGLAQNVAPPADTAG